MPGLYNVHLPPEDRPQDGPVKKPAQPFQKEKIPEKTVPTILGDMAAKERAKLVGRVFGLDK